MKWALETFRVNFRNDAQTIQIIQDVIDKLDGAQAGVAGELAENG